MSNKDQFTFSDDDDFPETDLSSAFSEGEHAAELQPQEKPEPKGKGDGGGRMRILLMLLLLVVAGAAGAYYFMDLGGTTPMVPAVPVLAQKTTKSVALPPQPANAPSAPVQTGPAEKPITISVPPPPVEQPAESASDKQAPAKEIAASQPEIAKKLQSVPEVKPAGNVADTKSTTVTVVVQPEVKVAATASQKPAVPAQPASSLAGLPKPAEITKPVGGPYALDAGSYLLESNRDILVEKARKLGYETLVTPIDAKLDMTRLRLGTFSKDEVQGVLTVARTIEPAAYSAPAGDRYVIYAGTFLQPRSVEKLTQRFAAEGFKVYAEPVQVVRTLSRIRFGSFVTKEDAEAAALAATEAGLQATVVKFE